HWRPDAALFVESELWPNMLRETRASGVAMALVNARISDRSVRRWKRFRSTARSLLDLFDVIHCQDDRTAAHLRSLGLKGARRGINLKALAGPLPVDEAALDRLRACVKNRPLWLAASTHPGEDEIALAAHRILRQAYPDALLLLAPRHPDRATSIKALISAADLSVAQRSTGERPTPDCAVYLADTLGEMGLWYTLSPLTLLCGSLVDVGGHNPYEPAQTGSYILHGPHYANFEPVYRDLDASGAGEKVADAPAIAERVAQVWSHPESLQSKQAAARAFARQNEDGLESLAEHLFTRLRLS
ncbi:MAG: glycosyltransferase N-terminal domain-containing protein, partial [Pseudomonadota bacterium]